MDPFDNILDLRIVAGITEQFQTLFMILKCENLLRFLTSGLIDSVIHARIINARTCTLGAEFEKIKEV